MIPDKKEPPPISLRVLSMSYKYGDPIPQIDFSALERYGIGSEQHYVIASRQKHIEIQIRDCLPLSNSFKIFYYVVDTR
jgi:hypothetical protein